MAEVETLDILGEIQSLVSDKLQVVSYKWLSRNFSVSSNDAKRILQEFVEQNGTDLEVVYSLAGYLKKNTPPVYHVCLVSGDQLSEVKGQYEGECSVQVYSVQACIPKDPAALWNFEFVQTEELFNQSPSAGNCLRDNRFGGVLNSFVKCDINRKSSAVAPQQSKNTGVPVPSKSNNIALQTPIISEQKGKEQHLNVKSDPSPVVAAAVVKTESNVSHNSAKANSNTGKVATLPATKKKVQNGKSSSGTGGGSLANMWGRASVKSKPTSPSEPNKDIQNAIGNLATADAQICAREAIDNVSDDDDEAECVNYKRASNGESNRKRRVVMDFSDDDDVDDAVNLGSPDPPKKHSSLKSGSDPKMSLSENINLNFDVQNGEQSKTEEENVETDLKQPPKEDEVIVSKNKTNGKPVKTPKNKTTGKAVKTPDSAHQKDKATDNGSNSTKKRKVLKTRIDERGREVTEVVWEGEETENKNNDTKEIVPETTNNRPLGAEKSPTVAGNAPSEGKKSPAVTPNAPLGAKKSPAVASNAPSGAMKSPAIASNVPSNPAVKGGAKKGGKAVVKDPKQGNIMSFFKKG